MWTAFQVRRAERGRARHLAEVLGYQPEPDPPITEAPQPLVAWGLQLARIEAAELARREST